MKTAALTAALWVGRALAGSVTVPLSPDATATDRPAESTIEPSTAAIASASATVKPLSPTSDVKGVAFNRIVQVWLENTDFNASAADPSMQWLASQGILLTNYFATTHPSQPNYAAVVGGDNFGMENDDFDSIPANVSTVVDLLDTKGITWGEYQEGIPYAGFRGYNYSNQATFANNYVRKHNPLIFYDSVTSNATRLSLIKGLGAFADDLKNQKLPQWSFITPNMTNDGHDTNITFAASWARGFLEPLLNNSYFSNDTLVILTFDENESYSLKNRIYTVLLGGAIPDELKGTADSMFYNHYSTISTVSVNWGLPSLGRWDCDANVLALVANKTGYKNSNVTLDNLYFNQSYPGPLSDSAFTPGWWPVPNTQAKCAAGKGVLSSIADTWGTSDGSFNYTNVYPYGLGENTGGTPVVGANDAPTSTSGSSSGSGSGSTGTTSSTAPAKGTNAAAVAAPESMLWFGTGVAGLLAALL